LDTEKAEEKRIKYTDFTEQKKITSRNLLKLFELFFTFYEVLQILLLFVLFHSEIFTDNCFTFYFMVHFSKQK